MAISKKQKIKSVKSRSFSKREAISFGFKTSKKNIAFFLGIFAIWILIQIVSSGISESLDANRSGFLSFLFSVLMWVVNTIISMGIIVITLKFVDNKKPKLKDIFYTKSIFNFIIASIIRGVIGVIGFALFIIPGIIFSIKLQFAGYLIVDKGMGAVESIKKSWKMTKGVKWNLFLLGLLLCLINLLGVLCLVIGLFVTIPLTMVAEAYVYRKLLSKINSG